MAKLDVRNMSLEKIDKAFVVKSDIEKDDIAWFDVRKAPFNVYGLYNPETEEVFKRMPTEVAEKVNIGVHNRSFNTSGGRIRFKTNSPYLAIKVEYSALQKAPHFTLSGMNGMDIYTYKDEKFKYFSTVIPSFEDENGYERLIELGENKIGYGRSPIDTHENTEYVLTMPLYNSVNNVYIGIKEGSHLESGSEYKISRPIVYYGSSTTQGGCATRAGLMYPEIISRRFNADYINLGFSGSAHGEEAMMEYIASLPMSVFVYDFDYNSDANGIRAKHFSGYKIIREKNPELPIVVVGHANFFGEKWNYDRLAAMDESVAKMKALGDENVAYISSPEIYGDDVDSCTVDGIHPNDLGFYKLSEKLGEVLEKILK